MMNLRSRKHSTSKLPHHFDIENNNYDVNNGTNNGGGGGNNAAGSGGGRCCLTPSSNASASSSPSFFSKRSLRHFFFPGGGSTSSTPTSTNNNTTKIPNKKSFIISYICSLFGAIGFLLFVHQVQNFFTATSMLTPYCTASEDATTNLQHGLDIEWIYNKNNHDYHRPKFGKTSSDEGDNERDGSRLYRQQGRYRLLIGQYLGHIPSEETLLKSIFVKINKAYALKWQQDYVILKSKPNTCQLTRRQYERVLTNLAYTSDDKEQYMKEEFVSSSNHHRHHHYDQILTLDGNTIIYDFDQDITKLVEPSSSLLWTILCYICATFHRLQAWEFVKPATTLWNLKNIGEEPTPNFGMINNEFGYADTGTMVRTLQPDSQDWTPLDRTIGFICLSQPSICNHNNTISTAAGGNGGEGQPVGPQKQQPLHNHINKREPRWDWRYYSKDSSLYQQQQQQFHQRRVLLAQYSAFGTYAQLLELTAPINKAYSQKFHYDYVALQGTTLELHPRDSWYPPPEERSRFNKIELLQTALSRNYDYVLLLDADAMIYDFNSDIVVRYLPQDYLLAAHRVFEADSVHTWDINNGVTLWNLNHPLFKQVVDDWEDKARTFLNRNPTTRSYMVRGDQSFLHSVLKRLGSTILSKVVWSSSQEFQYRNATVIKHFIRENLDWSKDHLWQKTSLDQRMENIIKVENEICIQHRLSCDIDLERTVYTD